MTQCPKCKAVSGDDWKHCKKLHPCPMRDACFYRFYDRRESRGYTDVHGEYVSTGSVPVVHMELFRVLRHTPKGAWIDVYGEKKFVLLSANKRFACPTVEEAKASFIARKTKQRRIHMARAAHAQEAIDMITLGKGAFL